MFRLYLVFVYLLVFSANVQGQDVWIRPNEGQWDDRIEYQVDLSMGKMFIGKDGFTFNFYEQPETHGHIDEEQDSILKAHAVKTKFIGSNWNGDVLESNKSSHYANYYLGNAPQKWKTQVHDVGRTILKDFYHGIDLDIEGGDGELKYSFIVQPNIDASIIQMKIEGASSYSIEKNGDLRIKTSLGELIERKPIAWTINSGRKKIIDVQFGIKNNKVVYEFPNGYNHQDTLVIDPYLVFSTFTGSTADNWGMSATPGPNGETYAAGICFAVGYPTTTGAYDLTYNGGSVYQYSQNFSIPGFDIAISKFSIDGTQLLYSTYIGGNANELPESMISGTNGDLFVLGITGSPNFPISSGAYDIGFNGGPTIVENSLKFIGSDICVFHLNENGTALLGSTFLGGSSLDGLNSSPLHYNYGDQFRGEIILGDNENVFIASNTQSTDFPVTNGSTLKGNQDAVVVKLSNDLTSLMWSTYLGGDGSECANSLELSSTLDLYVAGGTTSSTNFNLQGVDPTFNGISDGFLAKFDGLNGNILAGTFMGDVDYDQCYFVKLDIDDFPYVFGQTETDWTISSGCYGNPNSGQFIRKYSNDLNSIEWTTMIGAGTGHPEISPTAFLISDCYDIFFSGWGGETNSQGSSAAFSTSSGFPISPSAHQTTTSGNNFYLGILSQDASAFVYGTYMGGVASSSNHVDGGTSRFDKSGAVYHAVCAACGGQDNGFYTSAGVWSTSNPSPNCNLAAFKFQLGEPYSLSPNSTICSGDPVQLNATGGITYSWSPSASLSDPNSPNPIATPTSTTVYYVEMDFSAGCAIVDSVVVTVTEVPTINLTSQSIVCSGDTTVLSASGNGLTYNWSPNSTISNVTLPNVSVWPAQSQYYYCEVTNECFTNIDSIYVVVNPLPIIDLIDQITICSGDQASINIGNSTINTWDPSPDLTVVSNTEIIVSPSNPQYFYVNGVDSNGCENRDSVFVDIYPIPPFPIINDTSVCYSESIELYASGMDSYLWSPSTSLSNPNIANPIATPLVPTTYNVVGTYAVGCQLTNSVEVDILYLPNPVLPDTLVACYNVEQEIIASGADSYIWSPSTYLDNTSGPIVHTTALDDITYTVEFSNICGSVFDSVFIDVIIPNVTAGNDTIICPDNSAILWANGATDYYWTPNTFSHTSNDTIIVYPNSPTHYIVQGIDDFGCIDYDTVFVDFHPIPEVDAGMNVYAFYGDDIQLTATSPNNVVYSWSPIDDLTCGYCTSPIANPNRETVYTVTVTDENGCESSDIVSVFYDITLYVPNTFTPDQDEFNQSFYAYGGNIEEFHMMIFDRWGELIFESYDMNIGWDGTYNGFNCQDGTYVWKIQVTDSYDKKEEFVGHVNLIR